MADISVIIVNYNVKDLLLQCINSILASKNLDVEIIVVDNNSFDGSLELISSKFRDFANIKTIANKENVGFAKANNIGVKSATGDYLLILNPDTILQEDTLEKSLGYLKSHPDIGALTCKLILPNGKLDLACRRSFPTPAVSFYRMVGLSKLFPKSKTFGKYNLTFLDENSICEVDAIVGAFMMMNKNVFEKVGGFDEDYFMYGEDIDLCFRIKSAGYKICYYPETSIVHYKGESTKKSSISYVNNFYGAMQIFFKKNLKGNFWIVNALIEFSIGYRAFISYSKRFLISFYPVIVDLLVIVVGMLIAIRERFETFPIEAYTVVIIIYTIVWILSMAASGSYNEHNRFSLTRPLNGILFGFFINSSFTYFFNEFAFSRAVVIRTAVYVFILMALWRLIVKIFNYSKRKNLLSNQIKTLIVGRNNESEEFVKKLNKRVESEYDMVGYISVDGNTGSGYVGNLNNLGDVIAANRIKNVLFAKNALSNHQILDLMWRLQNYKVTFKILTSDTDIILGKSALDKIDEIYLMQIEYNINKKFNILVKRLFDFATGLLCLLTVYPIVFMLLKIFKVKEDRLKFLKKILLIPAVVRGRYSIVGRATWDTSSYGKQHLGKNGLTGLVQINYYRNLTPDELEYYNFYYAKNQSLTLDIEIILKTISLYLFKNNVPGI